MFGPRSRPSIWPPTGVSFSSTPGAGTPIRPPVKSASPAQSANGALSVAPRPVTNGIRTPDVSVARSIRSSAICCRSEAAAQKTIFNRLKK